MKTAWFKPRRYKHFDRPVCDNFAKKIMGEGYAASHSFSPLIFYEKEIKRYRRDTHKTERKLRPIMYASHRDACILSYYSDLLNARLNDFYQSRNLDGNVIAYRSLGRSNYDFSADAYRYASQHAPCMILAFDVSGFFDNLDHSLLKARLKRILDVSSLSNDWLRVLRSVTRFHFVERTDLESHVAFSEALSRPGADPICSVAELKAAGIQIRPNPKPGVGVPQGTPISAALSNLYMLDFDVTARSYCDSIGAFYRRYSDDVLVICSVEQAKNVEAKISALMLREKLALSASKTERTAFDPSNPVLSGERSAQYLGFSYYPGGAGIRPSSLSRQWRKMRRSVRRTLKAAEAAIAAGTSTKVYTKKLRRRFSPLQFRNFSSYARRSAFAFGAGQKITGQVKRLEREVDAVLRSLKKPSCF